LIVRSGLKQEVDLKNRNFFPGAGNGPKCPDLHRGGPLAGKNAGFGRVSDGGGLCDAHARGSTARARIGGQPPRRALISGASAIGGDRGLARALMIGDDRHCWRPGTRLGQPQPLGAPRRLPARVRRRPVGPRPASGGDPPAPAESDHAECGGLYGTYIYESVLLLLCYHDIAGGPSRGRSAETRKTLFVKISVRVALAQISDLTPHLTPYPN